MRIFIFILVLLSLSAIAQEKSEQLEFLGDQFFKGNNYDQARYHYKLSQKHSIDSLRNLQLIQKVFEVDSVEAYASEDPKYIALLLKAEDYLELKDYVAALKFFDDAKNVLPIYNYPKAKSERILENTPQIRKQLNVFLMKQNQQKYKKQYGYIDSIIYIGKVAEAYALLSGINEKHPSQFAKDQLASLEMNYGEEISFFNNELVKAETLFQKGLYEESIASFKELLIVNKACELCRNRIKASEYFLKKENANFQESIDEMILKADQKFLMSDYSNAMSFYLKVSKLGRDSEYVQNQISLCKELLNKDLQSKSEIRDIKLIREMADTYYDEEDYKKALVLYQKLQTKYSQQVQLELPFIESRIKDCLSRSLDY